MKLHQLAFAALFAAISTSTYAATLLVENTNDSGTGSLRQAVSNAANGDDIQFSPALSGQTITLTTGQLLTTRSITIDGSAAPGLTINGSANDRILYLGWAFDPLVGANVPTTVSIRNLRFINGRAKGLNEAGAGGAIYMLPVGQTLTVENCTFENNYSEGEGGAAIYCGNRGTLTINNCLFTGNIAETNDDGADTDKSERGGTVSTNGQGTLHVAQSTFINNRGVNGAAINVVDTNLLVENSTFSQNDTKYYPQLYPSPAAMPASRAYGYGGAIYVDGANRAAADKYITLRNNTLTNNIASGQGGAAFLYGYRGDRITIENTTFSNNEVVRAAYAGNNFSLGGGLVVSGGVIGSRTAPLPAMTLEIHDSTFANNRSYGQGGGVWLFVRDATTAEMTNCTITNNQSFAEDPANMTNGLGGGLTINGTANTFTLRNLTITYNTASLQGGGIDVDTGNNIAMYDTLLAFNEALNGGNTWNIRHNTNLAMNSGSNNLQYNALGTSAAFLRKVTPDIIDADPLITALADNGGTTQTVALQAGSPAINAGTDTLGADQRGYPKSSVRDIGAFEYLSAWDTWRVANGLPLDFAFPAATAGSLDSDGDGLVDLLEYAFGGDPRSAASAPHPTFTIAPAGPTLTFERTRGDLNYHIVSSIDLGLTDPWVTIAENPGSLGSIVSYTDSANATDPKRFYRLQLSFAP